MAKRPRIALMLVLAMFTSGLLAARKAEAEAICKLVIEGRDLESLTLIERNTQSAVRLPRPGGRTARLPAGTYRVEDYALDSKDFAPAVRLGEEKWFELSPDEPYTLVIGPPLHSTVEVTRQGRSLRIDYRVVDGGGRRYFDQRANRRTDGAPRFTIYADGREVASGQFEYG